MDPITLLALGAGAYFLSRKKQTPTQPAPPDDNKAADLPSGGGSDVSQPTDPNPKTAATVKVKDRQERRKKLAERKKRATRNTQKKKRANNSQQQQRGGSI